MEKKELKKKGYWIFAFEMLNIWNAIAYLITANFLIFNGIQSGILFIFISIFYMFISSKIIWDLIK